MSFIKLEDSGDPISGTRFNDGVDAILAFALALKRISMKNHGLDYVLPPLEVQWYGTDGNPLFASRSLTEWSWIHLVSTPSWLTVDDVELARQSLASKVDSGLLSKIDFASFHEGTAVQILHIGMLLHQEPLVRRMLEEFIPEYGFVAHGPLHQIYLSDYRRMPVHQQKRIIRQPVFTPTARRPTSTWKWK